MKRAPHRVLDDGGGEVLDHLDVLAAQVHHALVELASLLGALHLCIEKRRQKKRPSAQRGVYIYMYLSLSLYIYIYIYIYI